jgi:radical SAM-linked protein
LVFALSLPLGVVGVEEVVELELAHSLPVEVVHASLAGEAPAGLAILSVQAVDMRASAHVRRLCYRVALPSDGVPAVRGRVADFLAKSEYWVERTRPPVRRINLRASLEELRVTETGAGAALDIVLCPTPAGTARPEEVLHLLGLEELTASGAVLERCRLELVDEIPTPPAPPVNFATDVEAPSAESSPVAEGIA